MAMPENSLRKEPFCGPPDQYFYTGVDPNLFLQSWQDWFVLADNGRGSSLALCRDSEALRRNQRLPSPQFV
jgi:hypothetical protein